MTTTPFCWPAVAAVVACVALLDEPDELWPFPPDQSYPARCAALWRDAPAKAAATLSAVATLAVTPASPKTAEAATAAVIHPAVRRVFVPLRMMFVPFHVDSMHQVELACSQNLFVSSMRIL
jgi:hypothetical protein